MTADIKQEVRQFYDQVGWSRVGDDLYQNARYEDLRPVAREYIHRCHLRVSRHLDGHTTSPQLSGRFLLDAGSGRSNTRNMWNIREITNIGFAPIFRSLRLSKRASACKPFTRRASMAYLW